MKKIIISMVVLFSISTYATETYSTPKGEINLEVVKNGIAEIIDGSSQHATEVKENISNLGMRWSMHPGHYFQEGFAGVFGVDFDVYIITFEFNRIPHTCEINVNHVFSTGSIHDCSIATKLDEVVISFSNLYMHIKD